jgi:beta-lactamase class A
MIRRGFLAASLCLSFCSVLIRAQDVSVAPQIQSVQKRIQESGADVAVAYRTLDGKSQWSFHAASTMKIPDMIELFHEVREGKLKLDDTLPIKNQFHSLVDGSVFTLDPKDDSEVDLYKAEGQTRTLRQLCELMITVSSNFATNLLVDTLGIDNIRATVHSLHADGMNVLRGVEDNKAYQKGLNNTTTARGLAVLLEAIATAKPSMPTPPARCAKSSSAKPSKKASPPDFPPVRAWPTKPTTSPKFTTTPESFTPGAHLSW